MKYCGLILGVYAASFFAPLGLNTLLLVVVLVFSLLYFDWKNQVNAFKNNLFAISCLIYFSWHGISIAWSSDVSYGFQDLLSKASLIVIPFLLAPIFNIPVKEHYKAWWIFIGSAVLVFIYAFAMAAIHPVFVSTTSQNLIDAFTYESISSHVDFQPIYLSLYLISAFFLTLYHAIETGKFKWYHIGCLAVFFGFLIMLSSRMEIMVFFAVLATFMMVWGHNKGQLKKMILITSGLFVLTVGLIMSSSTSRQRFTEMLDTKQSYTENAYGGRGLRIQKWKFTLECWMKQPMLGTGAGDYSQELQQTYMDNDFKVGYVNHYNSHNQFLQTLLTSGIIGLLSLLFLFGSAIYQGYRHRNWVAFTFIFVFALSCLTESMLERQRGIVFFVFFTSFLLSRKSPAIGKKV